MAIDFDKKIPYVQAKWYTELKPGRAIRLIVIHSMEAAEKGTTAESCANYFKNCPSSRKASAHYCLDNNSIVQCVQTKDVAYAAPGANHNGVHLELAGYARQTRQDWLDAYSLSMIKNAAGLCAAILSPKFDIPPIYIDKTGLVNNALKGVTMHRDVSAAFKKSTHTDPGSSFPMDIFLKEFKNLLENSK